MTRTLFASLLAFLLYSPLSAQSTSNFYNSPFQSTSSIPTTPPSVSTALSQQYPQPAQPYPAAPPPVVFNPITVPITPYQQVTPPVTWTPGLATIKEGSWAVSDYLYNLTPNIGVKVEVLKPENQYLPLSDRLLEQRVIDMFHDAYINPTAVFDPCSPPLPFYHIMILAYSCGRRCVGVVTGQLYEVAQPARIEDRLNGVWQVITWQRQELVASACEDFAQEIDATISGMTHAFLARYDFYNPIPSRPCFPGEPPPTRPRFNVPPRVPIVTGPVTTPSQIPGAPTTTPAAIPTPTIVVPPPNTPTYTPSYAPATTYAPTYTTTPTTTYTPTYATTPTTYAPAYTTTPVPTYTPTYATTPAAAPTYTQAYTTSTPATTYTPGYTTATPANPVTPSYIPSSYVPSTVPLPAGSPSYPLTPTGGASLNPPRGSFNPP